MKLINLGFLLSTVFCFNQVQTTVDVTTLSGNNTIMGRCFDTINSYGRGETGPMVKGRKYRIGTVKYCGGKWLVGLMHWKNYHHGWPDNIFGTWSWGIGQDTQCNAKNKAFVRLENDGKIYDDERSKRYAYSDSVSRPWQSGSAMCTIVTCRNNMEFVPTNRRFNVNGKVYNGYKWKKNSAASSRNYFDLRCSGDDVYSTGDIEESFFFLLY